MPLCRLCRNMERIKAGGWPKHLTIFLRNVANEPEATVRADFEETELFRMRKGAIQESPGSFNFCSKYFIGRAEEKTAGVKTGARNHNNLRYTVQAALLANNEDLGGLIRKLKVITLA